MNMQYKRGYDFGCIDFRAIGIMHYISLAIEVNRSG